MNIKNLFLALFTMSAVSIQVNAQQRFEIKGTLKGFTSDKVFINYRSGSGMVGDSAIVANNSFYFKGLVPEVAMAAIMIPIKKDGEQKPSSMNQVVVYLENGTIQVAVDQDKLTSVIGGTPLNEVEQNARAFIKPFQAFEKEIEAEFKSFKDDTNKQDSIREVYVQALGVFDQMIDGFILSNSQSMVALNLLRRHVDPNKSLSRAEGLYKALSDDLKQSRAGLAYAGAFVEIKKVDVGADAPDFTLPDVNGKQLGLSSFRGKYVLIDFWASWCGPCRRENPNLVHAYNQYKGKNFDVLGISLDEGEKGRDQWLAAIKQDGLVWQQVSDLQGWSSTVAQLYRVQAIPANFLIDPSGKIVARDLRGDELEKKLSELL